MTMQLHAKFRLTSGKFTVPSGQAAAAAKRILKELYSRLEGSADFSSLSNVLPAELLHNDEKSLAAVVKWLEKDREGLSLAERDNLMLMARQAYGYIVISGLYTPF